MIYVVDFDVPYDEWHTIMVTQDIEKAINCLKTTEANSIKVWKNEEFIDDFNFSNRYAYKTDEEYIKKLNEEILL